MLMGGKAAPVSKRSRKKTAPGWQVYKSGLGAWGEMGGVKGTKAGKKRRRSLISIHITPGGATGPPTGAPWLQF